MNCLHDSLFGEIFVPEGRAPYLSAHYAFSFHFCNARAGWEKGHVERSVEYVRRKAFSLSVNYASLDEAQAHLDSICRQMDSEAPFSDATEKQLRISADMASMRQWPGDIGCFEAMEYRVSKWSAVCVRGNHYSVPDRLVGAKSHCQAVFRPSGDDMR